MTWDLLYNHLPNLKIRPELENQQAQQKKDLWARIALALRNQLERLPRAGTHRRSCYDIVRCDDEDVYAWLRDDYVGSREIVCQLVDIRKNGGGWGRGKYAAKFWLKERFRAAYVFCCHQASCCTPQTTRPLAAHTQVVQAVATKTVQGDLDTLLVDYWIQNRVADLSDLGGYGDYDPESEVAAKDWIQSVQDGAFLPAAEQARKQFVQIVWSS